MGSMVKALAEGSWWFSYDPDDNTITVKYEGGSVLVSKIDGGYSTLCGGNLAAHITTGSVMRYMDSKV